MEGRDTAIQVWVSELSDSKQVQTQDSSTFLINGKSVNRIRICGIAVSSDVFVDDSTGSILVRSFERNWKVNVGDCVLVIGRPRSYDGELYILGEIVKKVDPAWLSFWRKKYPIPAKASSGTRVLEIVRQKDAGDGADYDSVISELGEKGEELIVHMLATGELFETKPGKLKVLE